MKANYIREALRLLKKIEVDETISAIIEPSTKVFIDII